MSINAIKVKVIIADDHPLLLNGTKVFLEQKQYQVLGIAKDGLQAYNLIIEKKPDIAILDFDMPKLNALEIARLLKKNNLTTKIVLLTLHKQDSILKEIGKTIDAYILKEASVLELEQCLATVTAGKTYISKALRHNIYFKTEATLSFNLTPSEIKILRYLSKELSSPQIADELFILVRTVEKHRSNIIKKINLDSPSQHALILWLKDHPEIFE